MSDRDTPFRCKFTERESALRKKNENPKELFPFVTQYQPSVPNIKKIFNVRMALDTKSAFSTANFQRATTNLV